MKITDRVEIEFKKPEKMKVEKQEDKIIFSDDNVVITVNIFTEKYIQEILQEMEYIT